MKKVFCKNLLLLCVTAFLLPCVLWLITYYSVGVWPFGDRTTANYDALCGYVPYLAEFRRRFADGGLFSYTWTFGSGMPMQQLFFYYLASPFNLLFLMGPDSFIPKMFGVVLALKVGFAGLCMFLSLRFCYGQKHPFLLFFSTAYAMCGWACGYAYNIPLLDTFAVLPLAAGGMYQFVTRKKWRLYVISLAYVVVCNYYIGFMCCMFLFFYFFYVGITEGSFGGRKMFFLHLFDVARYSVLSLGICSVALFPGLWSNLFSRYVSADIGIGFLSDISGFFEDSLESMFYFTAYRPYMYGSEHPYLYVGILSLFLFMMQFVSKDVSKKRKICTFVFFAMMCLCVVWKPAAFVWHGFRSTHGVPWRFTFLISFFVILLASLRLESLLSADCVISKKRLFVLLCGFIAFYLFGSVVSFLNRNGKYGDDYSVIVPLFYIFLALLLFVSYVLYTNKKVLFSIMVLLVVMFLDYAAYFHVEFSNQVLYNQSLGFDKIFKHADSIPGSDGEGFYRVSVLYDSYNTNGYGGFMGVNYFGSDSAESVDYAYVNSGQVSDYQVSKMFTSNNLFSDLLFGVKYHAEKREDGTYDVSESDGYVGMGYMVEGDGLSSDQQKVDSVAWMNYVFRDMSGMNSDLFVEKLSVKLDHKETVNRPVPKSVHDDAIFLFNDISFSQSINKTFDGPMYVSISSMPSTNYGDVYMSCSSHGTEHFYVGFDDNIFTPSSNHDGCKLDFNVTYHSVTQIDENMHQDLFARIGSFDLGSFLRFAVSSSDRLWNVESHGPGYAEGRIDAGDGGMMFLSIPYHSGWKAYIDGHKTAVQRAYNGFLRVNLDSGEHFVRLEYTSPLGWYSFLLSVSCFTLYLAMAFGTNHRSKAMQS